MGAIGGDELTKWEKMQGSLFSGLKPFFFPFSLDLPQHEDRTFVLKFCAMEIYNEAIRDLLCTDSTLFRVLDDPKVSFVRVTFYVDKLKWKNE
ncbi:hypothetical protein RHMOL_Rhmol11G0052200 [Rhododendron molle]|uniref:Uncharacterized protein n=1 Tax=Rhododendron molle TaxID=49168 RepID=A0ACC0LPV3_RHOML|nr:hypothetical protein RHMOL_Rhmol11G0052200 [Rhododendron molle]